MEKDPLLLSNRNEFIEENKGFIYSVTCNICNRKLDWINDDELSIALIAFNKACDTYNSSKGNFLSYSKVLIKNSLIDFFRREKNNPHLMFEDEEEKVDYIDNKGALAAYKSEIENSIITEEIVEFSKELLSYKLSLKELVKATPSHIDTRNKLLNIAFKCLKEGSIIEYIKIKKKLPIKEIMLLTSSNRKLLESWRKYILALIVILSSDEYSYIKSHLNIKVGEYNE